MPAAGNSQIAIDKVLIDLHEAAERLSISKKFCQSEAIAGRIPSCKIGRRRLFSPLALEQWAADQVTASSGGVPGGGD